MNIEQSTTQTRLIAVRGKKKIFLSIGRAMCVMSKTEIDHFSFGTHDFGGIFRLLER